MQNKAIARFPRSLGTVVVLVAVASTSVLSCAGDDGASNDTAGSSGTASAGTSSVNGGASAGGSEPAGGDTTSNDAGTSSASAGASSTGDSGLRTLETCTTDVADGTPEFFSRYFKCVKITTTNTDVLIASQNLPPHKSNYWGAGNPNYVPFDKSRGSQYKANPNTLQERDFTITIPKTPVAKGLTITSDMVDGVVRTSTEEYPMSIAGVALDSVTLFNPLAAAGDDIEVEKYTFDDYNAHPDGSHTYHYHTTSPGPLEVLTAIGVPSQVELYGIMCDGTVVLGCTELDGTDVDLAALDAQGGHVTDIKDERGTLLFEGRYHTHVCPTKTGGRPYTPEIQYYKTCGK